MNPLVRFVGFAAVLVAVFAAAAFAGAEIDPSVDEAPDHGDEQMNTPQTTTETGATYALEASRANYDAAPNARYDFRIVNEHGETVRDFGVEHKRRMHLIVVRRDFGSFQHVHPRQLGDGSWQVEVDLSEAGTYRVFADFTTGDTDQVLSSDVHVAGEFVPVPAQPVSDHASAGDGYEVTLSSPAPRAGTTSPAEFTVTRNGRELGSVEPYLGADGHLVALSEADLEYLHTHPEGEPGGSGPITFDVEYPSPGRYRLYLQFKHEGEVRTAAFTQQVTGGVAGETGGAHEEDANGHG